MAKQQWHVLCYFLTHLAMAVADRSSHRQPGPTKSNKASQVKPWEERSSKVQQGQPGPAMGSNVQQSPATNMKHLQHCTTRSTTKSGSLISHGQQAKHRHTLLYLGLAMAIFSHEQPDPAIATRSSYEKVQSSPARSNHEQPGLHAQVQR